MAEIRPLLSHLCHMRAWRTLAAFLTPPNMTHVFRQLQGPNGALHSKRILIRIVVVGAAVLAVPVVVQIHALGRTLVVVGDHVLVRQLVKQRLQSVVALELAVQLLVPVSGMSPLRTRACALQRDSHALGIEPVATVQLLGLARRTHLHQRRVSTTGASAPTTVLPS